MKIINCKPSIIVNLNDYRKQLTLVTVFGSLNSLDELLDFQTLPNPDGWSILQLNLSRNNIPAIDKSAVKNNNIKFKFIILYYINNENENNRKI
jgi:hypothetical protein